MLGTYSFPIFLLLALHILWPHSAIFSLNAHFFFKFARIYLLEDKSDKQNFQVKFKHLRNHCSNSRFMQEHNVAGNITEKGPDGS